MRTEKYGMKLLTSFVLILFFWTFDATSAVAQKTQKTDKPTDNIKILLGNAAHTYSSANPFVFVVRDAKAYAEMRGLFPKLPAAETINFQRFAVAAIYLTLPNPCYGVLFEKNQDIIEIKLKQPPPNRGCIAVLSSSFAIILVPIDEDKKLSLEFDNDLLRMQSKFQMIVNFESFPKNLLKQSNALQ